MRRTLVILGALTAVIVAVIVTVGLGGGDGGYKVRAIFRNASFAIPGEDVKIAGAKVGQIESTDVTADGKAALVLRIDDPGFQDFRTDAECSIRLQSVIGEKLVECQPTQPHPIGAPKAPALPKVPDGHPGAGQHLLTEAHTNTPVDVDLINDINRLPYRQRLTIILNELGTGLAGRGEDLRKVIIGANPALQQLDRVIKVLADQNKQLRDLAVNGDKVVGAWAKKRQETADFIVQANTVAQATAERGDDLERNFERFPAFLRELKPTMERLGALSDEMTPVITDLGANGSDVSSFLIDLGPFARNAVPSFQTLGQTAVVGGPALEVARPVIQLLAKFAHTSRGLSANLKKLAVSLKETDTIQRAMDLIYYAALASNGYDKFGHYLRTALLTDCTSYQPVTTVPCNAHFSGVSASSASAAGVTPLAKLLRTPAKPQSQTDQSQPPQSQPAQQQQEQPTPAPAQPQQQPTPGPAAAVRSKRGTKSQNAMLDYLLGSDAK